MRSETRILGREETVVTGQRGVFYKVRDNVVQRELSRKVRSRECEGIAAMRNCEGGASHRGQERLNNGTRGPCWEP
jgi:hypothetical protein